MTCIVGLVEDDKVYIGGDSAGVKISGVVEVREPIRAEHQCWPGEWD